MTTPAEPSYTKPFIPVGLCQCGCGAQTKLAPANDPRYGIKKGEPLKFLRGHARARQWVIGKTVPTLYPLGDCQCGCGGKTKISKQTDKAWSYVKGQPRPYIQGHQNLLSPYEYVEEDGGYGSPCWIWQRATTQGYGRLWQKGYHSPRPAHRVYYERHRGPVPDDMDIDHLCRVRLCVNPYHLEIVTRAENVRRGLNSKLTDAEVRVIRNLRAKGWTYARLSKLFYVAGETCRRICERLIWADLV